MHGWKEAALAEDYAAGLLTACCQEP
jgi:hypothetical protein